MYCHEALPPAYRFISIEMGRKHTGTEQQRMAEWQRLKAQGVVPGIEDSEITGPGRLKLPIEFKAGHNKLSEHQINRRDHLISCGFPYLECRSITGLHDCLVAIGVPVLPSMRILALNYDAALSVPEPVEKAAAPKARAEKPQAATLEKMAKMRARTMC
jgi:hypothetical protein